MTTLVSKIGTARSSRAAQQDAPPCTRTRAWRRALLSLLLGALPVSGCSAGHDHEPAATSEAAITSELAKILDFRFTGEVIGPRNGAPRKAVVAQLMYVQGILTTARHGNGQIRNVKLTNVRETAEGDKKRITYEASLPVAWPDDLEVPSSYELTLPRDVTERARFDEKYDGRCGRRLHGKDTFWHDFDPNARRCKLDDADVTRRKVTVAPHSGETQNKYPEYDLLWADDRLGVVAIFGIIERKKRDDYGFSEADRFIRSAAGLLSKARTTDNQPSESILLHTTVTGSATVGGRTRDVAVDVFVVDRIERTGADFDARYDALTENADILMYNGHTESGEGLDALSHKGKVVPGHYQLVLLNGCQSFALMDDTMTHRRRAANGDADPAGTKFLDVVTNALPGYADTLASVSAGLLAAAVKADTPKHYNELLSTMPEANVAVVFGEEDNRFTP